jgi:HAD superfamily hydrolase (TIGR01509 family)
MAYKNILGKFGIDFTPEVFVSMAGISAVGSFTRINEIYGINLDPQEYGMIKEEEYEKIMHRMKPIGPVVEVIREYQGRLPMAVGTGGYRRLAWKTLDILGLSSCFKILVSSEDISHPKPHPETFLKCAGQMGVDPELCQVFEDGRLGIQAASAAGMMVTDVTAYYEVTIGKDI